MNILVLHQPDANIKPLKFSDDAVAASTFTTDEVPVGPQDLVVRWGAADGFDPRTGPVLNAADALRNVEDDAYVVAMLQSHGIRTRYMKSVLGRMPRIPRYRVHVCDMRILSVTRLRRNKYVRIRGGRSRRLRNVRELAIRIVYSLGLHFAAVEVGVIGRHYAVPVAVNPAPPINSRIGRLYAEAATAYGKRWRSRWSDPVRPVVLGADLEFVMRRRKGGIIAACRYFPYRGPIGYDEYAPRRRHPIAEIRPAPSSDPQLLVGRIRRLLRIASRRAPRRGVRWQAGSAPVRHCPIGGHVHFSQVRLTTEFVRALDNYLALPVMMLEDDAKARRRRLKYGYLGEVRWGRHGGFEYRTPSSWIVAPHFALAVLTLAKLIAQNYESLPKNIFVNPDAARAFYQSDKNQLRPAFDAAWADLSMLRDYDQVADRLAIIPQLVQDNKGWMESRDLRIRWGLVPRSRIRTRRRRRRSKR